MEANEASKLPKADDNPTWQFKSEGEPKTAIQIDREERELHPLSWTASEFIAHDKGIGWYALFIIGALGFAAVVYLLTKDIISAIMIVIIGIIFDIFASRKPRELQYNLDKNGLQVGPKLYEFGALRSFSIVHEEGIESIWFMPLKRFMPGLTIYFPPEEGEKIISILSQFLPFEDREIDLIDKLMHRLRF